MKKNLFKGILAMAGILLATSCSQDELVIGPTGGDYVDAKFTIETPDGIGTRSRDVGDGTTVDSVKCVVFNEADGKEIPGLTQTLKITEKKATYSTRLVKGQSYRIVFFAYNGNGGERYYDLTDMKAITVNPAVSNLEARDAFTAYTVVEAKQTMSAIERDVTLYRPFAQLNLGSNYDDWSAAVAADVNVTKTQIRVSNVYTAFNAFDDAVTGNAVEFIFGLGDLVEEPLKVDIDGDGTKEEYKYLALNYILVGDKGSEKSLTDVEFVWNSKEGKTNNPTTIFKNVPVQRNYRTNIIGDLLTNPAEFNIVIDADFDDEYNLTNLADGVVLTAEGVYELYNANGMFWFADKVNKGETFAGKKVVLTADIDLNNALWAPIGPNADAAAKFMGTFDGQDHTISNLYVKQGAAYHAAGLFGVLNGTVQNLVINGADITSISSGSATDNGTAVVAGSIYNTGLIKNVTVKAATVNGNRYVAGIAGYVYGKIENCTVEGSEITAACDNLTGEWDNGDKVGGIAGYFPAGVDNYIKDCVVNNTTIQGYRDLGGIVGYARGPVSGCSIDGVTITVDKTHDYKQSDYGDDNSKYDAGSIVGDGTSTDCTGEATITIKVTDGVALTAEGYAISNANGMFWFANELNVNGNTFAGKTVELANDIDLENKPWEPIGQTGYTQFLGTFDGKNHTISNLNIKNTSVYENCSSGLFGWIERHGNDEAYLMAVKNLNVEGAKVEGHHNCGVIAGYLIGIVENCHVTGADVVCSHANDGACGDKAGVIVGIAGEDNAVIKNCTAANSTVKAGRDAGQIVGAFTTNPSNVIECSATNVVVSVLEGCTGANVNNELIGRTE